MTGDDADSEVALAALTRLQESVRRRGVDLEKWKREVRAERVAAAQRVPFRT